jgi:cytoskeletal protein CcmA (bactofilin family)
MSAEGRLENGVLTAKHVKFKESARLEGDIDSVTGSAPTFTITIKGLPNTTIIQTNSLTEIDGQLDVSTAGHVRVRGRLSGANAVIATRIKVESSNKDDVILQGQVQAAADPSLTILGVVVNTTGVQFQGHDDGLISRDAFFSALTVNETLVKVKGKWNGTVVIWNEAELED